jgi:hypothetical protein
VLVFTVFFTQSIVLPNGRSKGLKFSMDNRILYNYSIVSITIQEPSIPDLPVKR